MKKLYTQANSDKSQRDKLLSSLFKIDWCKNYLESLIRLSYIQGKPYSIIDIEKSNGFPTSFISYPKSLFKYFPNTYSKGGNEDSINFSYNALCTNKVFMQDPKGYNDPYDTHFFIDREKYISKRLKYYLKLCDVSFSENDKSSDLTLELAKKVNTYLKDNNYRINSLNLFFGNKGNDGVKTLTNKIFILNMQLYVRLPESKNDEYIYYNAVDFAINKEYESALNRDSFNYKMACFSQEFNSILMWSHYADSHKGFCIEYDLTRNEKNKQLFDNLFPVIYSDDISDITNDMLSAENDGITDKFIWSIYNKALLRKSATWKYENEWRLIYACSHEDKDFASEFFSIKKVYLGKNMPAKERQKIIDFCRENKIPYCGMNINHNKFEMEICKLLCEDCSHFKKQIDKIVIRELDDSDKDIKPALELVMNVFKQYVEPEYSQQGIDTFYRFIEEDSIINNLGKNDSFKMWAAYKNDNLVGVVAVKDSNHISLFFVDSKYQKQGVGKKLFTTVVALAIKNKIKRITVNSSPFATPIYHHYGFKDTGVEKNIDGIRFTPMEYDLSDFYSTE